MKKTVGIVGARGHTGAERIRLLAAHPGFELASCTRASSMARAWPTMCRSTRARGATAAGARRVGAWAWMAWVLALPNGKSDACMVSLAAAAAPPPIAAPGDAVCTGPVVVDLSADHRSTRAVYACRSLRATPTPASAHRHPGCYASAMQLAVAPMVDCSTARCSASACPANSGAGTTPSDRNDADSLRDT